MFTERRQEMMTTNELENTKTPDPAGFFPAVGTNLSLGSARRRTLQLYGEQFPEPAVARGRASDDSDVKSFKHHL